MRRFTEMILVLIVVVAMATASSAATLVWNASSGTVEGYKVHYGTNASNPTKTIDVGKATQYRIDSLPLSENTQYFLGVSAYNAAGESAPCAPVAYTPGDATPPTPPAGLVAE